MKRWLKSLAGVCALACLLPAAADAQLGARGPAPAAVEAARTGTFSERGQSPLADLAEMQRFQRAIGALRPQRPGTVDVFVVVAGFDADLVFGREAAAVADVLTTRYDARGRTLLISAGEGAGEKAIANGNPRNFGIALAAASAAMDPTEDVLVVYTTSHGHDQTGLAYLDGARGRGHIGPDRLKAMFDALPVRNRLIIISACHSGVFVPKLASPTTVIATAAATDRVSFGCAPGNDWTFFGDALVNNALRKPQGFAAAFDEAKTAITRWETTDRLPASQPQYSAGDRTDWLAVIDGRMRRSAGTPVGRAPWLPPDQRPAAGRSN